MEQAQCRRIREELYPEYSLPSVFLDKETISPRRRIIYEILEQKKAGTRVNPRVIVKMNAFSKYSLFEILN